MLVLSRKIGEAIVIDGGIVVRVAEIHGGRVRLAIEAPRSVRIDREEIHERVAASDFQPIPDPCFIANPPPTVARRVSRAVPVL